MHFSFCLLISSSITDHFRHDQTAEYTNKIEVLINLCIYVTALLVQFQLKGLIYKVGVVYLKFQFIFQFWILVMDDFVQRKLTEWKLSERIVTFESKSLHLFCLTYFIYCGYIYWYFYVILTMKQSFSLAFLIWCKNS